MITKIADETSSCNNGAVHEQNTFYGIPVGGEPIDPTSFLQGWLIGRRLAGMRK